MVKASIVITTRNNATRILELLRKLSYQDFKNFEVIIIDLCSTDNTLEKTKSFPVKAFRLNSKEISQAQILNYIGRACAGNSIFSLWGGNIPSFENFISSSLKALEDAKTVLVFGEKFNENEAPIVKILKPDKWLGWRKRIETIKEKEIKNINLDVCAFKKGFWQKNNFPIGGEEAIWEWSSKLIRQGFNIKYNPFMAVKTKDSTGLINFLRKQSKLKKQFNNFKKKEEHELLA